MKRTRLNCVMASPIGILLALVALTGCSESERLAEFAADSTEQQAEQNVEMSRLNREVAESHQELAQLQHDLQAEQAQIGHQRDELEADREELAEARVREPIIASAISAVGLLLACLLPLVIIFALLSGSNADGPDEALGELLTLDLVADNPQLLPPAVKPVARLPDATNATADQAGNPD